MLNYLGRIDLSRTEQGLWREFGCAAEVKEWLDQGVYGFASRCYSRNMTARIRIEPGKRSGQPCVRGLRITVWDVLTWLAAGMTEQEILDDYPELEREDFPAVYDFAAHMGRRIAL
jgi:uncharacterized protein (DUF433 family)